MVFGSKALTRVVFSSFTLFSLLIGPSALAKHKPDYHKNRPVPSRPLPGPIRDYNESNGPSNLTNDADLVRAVHDHRDVNFVQGGGVTIVQILPEDHNGLPHQKWVIALSDGSRVTAVYNIDMGNKIPLKVGDHMAIGGQFKMTNIGPLIHWLHYDPRQTRPDGFVILNGVHYGSRQ